MNKIIIIVGLFFLISASAVFAEDPSWEEVGISPQEVKAVLIEPDNPNIIYIGAKAGIFKSVDAGQTWRNVLSVRGGNNGVNFLLFGPAGKNSLYAGTDSGLFYTASGARHWQKVFRRSGLLENQCSSLAASPAAIFLGTKQGLFVGAPGSSSWIKAVGVLGNSEITATARNPGPPEDIYIACAKGVFRLIDKLGSAERVFVSGAVENENNDTTPADDDYEKHGGSPAVKYIAISQDGCLYLAGSQGIYKSVDKGATWQQLPSYGLLDRNIKFLLISPDNQLYAVGRAGIFQYRESRWYELSLRLSVQEVNSISLDTAGNLYASTNKGLFKAVFPYAGPAQDKGAVNRRDCPEISLVQQAAIKYAELEPEKIATWRKQAKMKAVLPKLTIGLDRSENTNYEIYTSATTRYTYEGPHDRSNGWDVTLSWELGDLIWSDDQTNIDVRSRLTTQLRGDILDEVNKLYFELLRLKAELDNLTLEDIRRRQDKGLKIAELTASLNGLTGGYFSSN